MTLLSTTFADRGKQVLDGHNVSGGGDATLFVDGEPYLNFAGCNYLALGEFEELQNAAQKSLTDDRVFSRFLASAYGGYDEAFDTVEREAAILYSQESAVYFSSGYFIGFAGMTALRDFYDAIVLDEQAHWCLKDAAKLAGVATYTFAHCDPDSLSEVLAAECSNARPLVATDGAFATTGQLPSLDIYIDLVQQYDGQLLVDESHAAGGVGEKGRGATEFFELDKRVHVGTTLSKGFSGQGAVFVGSKSVVDRAREAPALRGATPGSPISARVSAAALKLVRENPGLVAELRTNTNYLRNGLQTLGLEIIESPAPIVTFSIGSFEDMRSMQQALFDEEVYVLHSNYIGAGPGGAIRLSVFRNHSRSDLDRVVAAIARVLAQR